jgi:rhodanese-related sulfurtransferase
VKKNLIEITFIIILSLLVILAGLSGCASTARTAALPETSTAASVSTANVQNVSVSEANDLINRNKNNPDFKIVDVRTAAEYQSGHLADALNIDFYSTDFETRLKQLDSSRIYLVYCRTGVRSATASQKMSDLGFSHVYNMLQGITGWTSAGYPTVQ